MVAPIGALATIPLAERGMALPAQLAGQSSAPSGQGFAAMLIDGVNQVEAKARVADDAVRAFALDDGVPVHQVSFALEQARLSLELMLQVRNRMVEGYQALMNMQL